MKTCRSISLILPVLSLFLTLTGCEKNEYNILFVVFDDLGTHLSSYGDKNSQKFNLTPNFDQLAEQGVQFNNAFCQAALCGPSRSSFLTGLRPDVTSVNTDHERSWMYEPEDVPEFFEIIIKHPTIGNYFREKGYYTARSGKVHHEHGIYEALDWEPTDYEKEPDAIPWLSPPEYKKYTDATGLPSYWQDTLNPITKDNLYPWSADMYKTTSIWEMHMDYDKNDPYRNRNMLWVHRTMDAMDKAVEKGKPFFVACGIVSNHDPYCQPKEFADKINPMEIVMPVTNGMKERNERPVPWAYYAGQRGWSDGTANWANIDDYLMRNNIPEAPWEGNPLPSDPGDIQEDAIRRKMLQSYYASVSYSDFLLGKLLNKLKALDIEENTIIAIVSDHGFHIFDHDLWNKTTQFRHSTRSVAFIHAPMIRTAQKNRQANSPVELIDFYPTLIDLCGLDIPEAAQGLSLIPMLKDVNHEIHPYAYSQFNKARQMGYTLVNQQFRYTAWLDNPDGKEGPINSGPEYGEVMMEELYDLGTDPQETKNISGQVDYADLQAKLRHDLLHFVKNESARNPFLNKYKSNL